MLKKALILLFVALTCVAWRGEDQTRTVDGITYKYDSTRGKWLSTDRFYATWSRDGAITAGAYAYSGTAFSAGLLVGGPVLPRDATVVGVYFTTSDVAAAPYGARLFAVAGPGYGSAVELHATTLLPVAAGTQVSVESGLDLDVAANTVLTVAGATGGGNGTDPSVVVEIAWRL